MSDLILTPGGEPPHLVPYCFRCDMPVERLCFDLTTSVYYIGIHSQCCGHTSSMRLPVEKYHEMIATGQKLYTVMPKGRAQGLRAMPKHDVSWLRAVT